MKKKVSVELKVKLILNVDEGIEVEDVVNELDYSFRDMTGLASVYDSTIEDFEVIS